MSAMPEDYVLHPDMASGFVAPKDGFVTGFSSAGMFYPVQNPIPVKAGDEFSFDFKTTKATVNGLICDCLGVSLNMTAEDFIEKWASSIRLMLIGISPSVSSEERRGDAEREFVEDARRAILAERERCAKIAERDDVFGETAEGRHWCRKIAAGIRDPGDKGKGDPT